MDFTLTDEQQAVADLATKLLGDQSTPTRLKALEETDEVFDRDLWAQLAEANLLGVAIPEAQGGLGLGLVELDLLLEQVGRTTAAVPVLATLAYGAAPVARFGTEAQRSASLPGVVTGDAVLTAALIEPLGDPLRPTTTATPEGDAWVLDGLKTCVPAGLIADAHRRARGDGRRPHRLVPRRSGCGRRDARNGRTRSRASPKQCSS